MTVLNFPATPTVNDTYTANNVTYTWNGSYWDANNTGSLDDIYVEVAGDVMTGNLLLPGGGGNTAALQKQEITDLPISTFDNDKGYITSSDIPPGTVSYWKKDGSDLKPVTDTDNVNIGNGKILLNADGSGTFAGGRTFINTAGQFQSFLDPSDGAGRGVFISNGLIRAGRSNIDDVIVEGFTVGVTKPGFVLTAGGSADFAGSVNINTDRVRINKDGYIDIKRDSLSDSQAIIRVNNADPTTYARFYLSAAGGPKFGLPDRGTLDLIGDNRVGQTGIGFGTTGEFGVIQLRASLNFDFNDNILKYVDKLNNNTRVFHIESNGTTRIGGTLTNSKVEANISLDAANGSAEFAGNVTAANVTFNLEADDPTKYTTDLDEEGNETQTYIGATLDVQESIETAVAARAAMRETFQELLVAVQSATDFGELKAAMLVALEDYA